MLKQIYTVANFAKKQELINSNNELIQIFEQKIKDKRSLIWVKNENTGDNNESV